MADKTLVIDTDCGVDDALALVLALTHQSCTVKAVTCCYGNTTLENVCRNVFRVLKTCSKSDIPVYSGAETSLLGSCKEAHSHHGVDGFGNISHSIPVDDYKTQKEHASTALVDIVSKCPYEITLVALGPLTNLALANKIDPTFHTKLKQLVIMGGNIYATGNATAAAEFNFYCDPEAAAAVLRDFKCPTLLVPWETCIDHALSWETFDKLIATETKMGNFFKRLTETSADCCRERKRKGYHSCDLYAMAALLQPEVITSIEGFHAVVELAGKHTRGQMIVERRPWIVTTHNIKAVLKFDLDKLATVIKNMLM